MRDAFLSTGMSNLISIRNVDGHNYFIAFKFIEVVKLINVMLSLNGVAISEEQTQFMNKVS